MAPEVITLDPPRTIRTAALDQVQKASTALYEDALQRYLSAGKPAAEADRMAQADLVVGLANIVARRIRA
jgi:hypothetical protein